MANAVKTKTTELGDSPYVSPEQSPTMRRLFPRTVLLTIKDAGHWVHSQHPETFTASVRHFLQQ